MNSISRLLSSLIALTIVLAGIGCFTEPSGSTGATSTASATPTAPSATPAPPSPTPTASDPTPTASPTAEPDNQPVTAPSSTPTPAGAQATPPTKVAAGGLPTDTRVVVNAPAFRMDLFEDGKLTKSYKIGIGYPEFPLPTALRKAETIIFSPTWTPPDEPWVESPTSKVKVGQKIEAGDKLNPLGLIKIPIGLPSLIHGGKAPTQIGGFASHGCVGLTNAQVHDFAKQLARVSGTQVSEEQIAEYEKNKSETKPVKLTRPIPVELRYETISIEEGKLRIYRDVYGRGTNTEENLRKALQAYGMTIDDLDESTRAQVMRALSQMARDARGLPVMESSDRSETAKSAKLKRADQPKTEQERKAAGKVTRIIRGAKEVVIEIPSLTGKGYPSPVDLDTGLPPKKIAPRRSPRKKK